MSARDAESGPDASKHGGTGSAANEKSDDPARAVSQANSETPSVLDGEKSKPISSKQQQGGKENIQGEKVLRVGNIGDNATINFITRELDSSKTVQTPRLRLEQWQRHSFLEVADTDIKTKDQYAQAKSLLKLRNFITLKSELLITTHSLIYHVSQNLPLANGVIEARYPLEAHSKAFDDFALELNALLGDILNIEKGSLIVVRLDELQEKGFWLQKKLSQFNSANSHASITSELKLRDLYCIFYLGGSYQTSDLRRQESDAIVYTSYEEEELLVRLADSVLSSPNTRGLIAKNLREQISADYWEKDPVKRLSQIWREIEAETLFAKIQKYEEIPTQTIRQEYTSRLLNILNIPCVLSQDFEHSKAVQHAITLKSWTPDRLELLVDHVLFIISHIEDINPRDFEWVMRRLLANKTITEAVQVVTQHNCNPAAGKELAEAQHGNQSSTQHVERTVSAAELYIKHADNLLSLLDIRLQYGGVLGFDHPLKRNIAVDIFTMRRPAAASRLLNWDTFEGNILFDASTHVAQKLAEAYADYLRRLQPHDQSSCLTEWMEISAKNFIEERLPELERPNDSGGLGLIFEAVVRDLFERELSELYSERMSLLFAELMRTPETVSLVNIALDNLMTAGRQAKGRFNLILHFIRRLRVNDSFDTLLWLKRLLSEGNEDAKAQALTLLANAVSFGYRGKRDAEVGSVLFSIGSWVPGKLEEAYSLNNQTAALLAPRLALHQSLSRLRENEYGEVLHLEPLIDLARPEGVSSEALLGCKLLTFKARGRWIVYDLMSLERIVSAKWNIPAEEVSRFLEPTFEHETTDYPLPTLAYIALKCGREIEDEWFFSLNILLIEVFTAFLGASGEESKLKLLKDVLRIIAEQAADREIVNMLARNSLMISRVLGDMRYKSAAMRYRHAKMIGGEFWLLHKGMSANKRN